MTSLRIDGDRLLHRIDAQGRIGRSPDGKLSRLALTDADKAIRDAVVGWMRALDMTVEVDAIGNIFGTWHPSAAGAAPVATGSHVDTVVDAGLYDGNFGVMAGLEVVSTLREAGFIPARPITVAVFTNEEGARFSPDMMGSLVHAGGLPLETALDVVGTDGARLGDELARIGYAGPLPPGRPRFHAFVELHIEQGPVLEAEGVQIGAVSDLQGISWQRLTFRGQANHAGTTPMALRRDAGHAAARLVTFVHTLAERSRTMATVGSIRVAPDVINVIPSFAALTLDLRDTDDERLCAAEAEVADFLVTLSRETGVSIEAERLARSEPVQFDARLVAMIEQVAAEQELSSRRMTSGAGHDAQMIARVAPSAMIFVPSTAGISHNPREHTDAQDLVRGANVLLGTMVRLSSEKEP